MTKLIVACRNFAKSAWKILRNWQLYYLKSIPKASASELALLQASAAKWMGTALFWVITQRVVVISCRRFGATYRYHLQESKIQKYLDSRTFKMEPIGCLQTSARNYHYSLRNDPEERNSKHKNFPKN